MASEFSRAFAAARKEKGANSTFTFKGKTYSTKRADDDEKETPTPPKRPANTGETKWADAGAEESKRLGTKSTPREEDAPARKPTPGWTDPGSIENARRDMFKEDGETSAYRKGGYVAARASGKRMYAKGGMVKGKSCG